MDTREMVPLVPSTMLTHVLSSANVLLVDAAVKVATPPQLCSYVQLCGVPVGSMSCVLEALDSTVQLAPKPSIFKEGLRDPALLCRCVEAQMMRGIQHGHSFHLYLKELVDLARQPDVAIQEMPSTAPVVAPMSPSVRPEPFKLTSLSEDKMEEALKQAFAPPPKPASLCPSDYELWEGLLSLVLETITSSPSRTLPTPLCTLVSALHRLVTNGGEVVVRGMASSRISCSLMRLLTRAVLCEGTDDDGGHLKALMKATIICVSESLKRLGTPSVETASSLETTPTVRTTPTVGTLLATVRSCAAWLGVAETCEEEGALAVRRAISSIRGAGGFSDDIIVQTCRDLLDSCSLGHMVEGLLCTLAKEAIQTGQEGNCIRVLCKLHPFLWAGPPIVLQASPQVFAVPSSSPQSATFSALDGSNEEPMDTGTISTPGPPPQRGGMGSLFSPTSRGMKSCFSLPPPGVRGDVGCQWAAGRPD